MLRIMKKNVDCLVVFIMKIFLSEEKKYQKEKKYACDK